jgi:hypothetical protein
VMEPDNCACGNPVEIEAGEDGGLMIVCDLCNTILINLSSDRERFITEWNQSVLERKNGWLNFMSMLAELP